MIGIILILRGGVSAGVDPGVPRYFYAGGRGRHLFRIYSGEGSEFFSGGGRQRIRGRGREGERRGGVIYFEIGLRFHYNFFRFQSGFCADLFTYNPPIVRNRLC